MKKIEIAKEVFKIAKELVAEKTIDSFPLKGKMKRINIDIDADNPVYCDGMEWKMDTFSNEVILSNGNKYSHDVRIYVYGFPKTRIKGVAMIDDGFQKQGTFSNRTTNVKFFGSVGSAINLYIGKYFNVHAIDQIYEHFGEFSKEDQRKLMDLEIKCRVDAQKSVRALMDF